MLLRLFLYLLCIAPLVVGALWLANHPGHIQMDWFGYRIETSLALALVTLAISGLLVGFVMLCLRAILSIPGSASRHNRFRRQEKGINALTHTLSALAISDLKSADKHLRQTNRYLGKEAPAALLLGAQLSHAKGDKQRARNYLGQMLQTPETRQVGLHGMIREAIQQKEYARALDYAREAFTAQPSERWLALTLMDLQLRHAEWEDAQTTIRRAGKSHAITSDDTKRYRALIEFERACKAIRDNQPERAIDLLKSAISLDATLQPVQHFMVKLLASQHYDKALFKAILRYWAIAPHSDYVDSLLTHFAGETPKKLQKRFDRLVATNPDHLESQLAMARLATHLTEWDTARNYLKLALTKHESPRIYQAFAEVEQTELGDEKAAANWLARAVNAPKDPLWVCSQCHHQRTDWKLHCPSCDSFDSLVWERPDHQSPEPDAIPALV